MLNKAALITSDCGMPGLARALCHRQHELFDRARPLPAWAAQLALQPILNIPRQLIREGQGHDAYAMLHTLCQAARKRTTAVIDGRPVDLSTITCAPDDNKTVRHPRHGRRCWPTAPEHSHWLDAGKRPLVTRPRTEESGTGCSTAVRLAILALLHDGQPGEAAVMVEQSTITEPREHAVQSLLRVLCLQTAGTDTGHHVATMLVTARALMQERDRSTTVPRTRIGMTALDLAGTQTTRSPAP